MTDHVHKFDDQGLCQCGADILNVPLPGAQVRVRDLLRERDELLHNREVERKEHAERDARMQAEVTKLHKTIAGQRRSIEVCRLSQRAINAEERMLSERRRQEIVRLQRRLVNQRSELREYRKVLDDLETWREVEKSAANRRANEMAAETKVWIDLATEQRKELDAKRHEIAALRAKQ